MEWKDALPYNFMQGQLFSETLARLESQRPLTSSSYQPNSLY